MDLGVEAGVLPACRELGIGFVSYSPLGRGFLAGRFTSPDEMDGLPFLHRHLLQLQKHASPSRPGQRDLEVTGVRQHPSQSR